jgi:hypothetical protein
VKKQISIILFLMFLFSLTIPLTNAIQFPSETKIEQYTENLVDSYNSLIKANHIKDNPHFEEFKKYFLLHHDNGYSFKVVVIKWNIFLNRTVVLIFNSIISPDIIYEFDYEHNITDYNPLLLLFEMQSCDHCIFRDNFYTSPEKIRYADLTLTVYSENITNSTMIDSTSYAKERYNEDNETFQSKINQKYPPNNNSFNITENISKENTWNEWIFTVILTILQAIIALSLFVIYKNFKKWRWHPIVTSIVIFIFQMIYSGIFYQFYLVDTLDVFHKFLLEKFILGTIPFIPLVAILIFIVYDNIKKEKEKKLKKLQKQQEKKDQQSKKNK